MNWKKCTEEMPPADKPVLAVGLKGGLFVGERFRFATMPYEDGTVGMSVKNARRNRSAYMWAPIELPEEFQK